MRGNATLRSTTIVSGITTGRTAAPLRRSSVPSVENSRRSWAFSRAVFKNSVRPAPPFAPTAKGAVR